MPINTLPGSTAGYNAEGVWNNPEFASTRDESFLKPEDVWGAEANSQIVPEWMQFTEQQRRDVSQAALDAKLYKESGGGVGIVDPQAFKDLAQGVISGKYPGFEKPMGPIDPGRIGDPGPAPSGDGSVPGDAALNRLGSGGSSGGSTFKPLPQPPTPVDPKKPWGKYPGPVTASPNLK